MRSPRPQVRSRSLVALAALGLAFLALIVMTVVFLWPATPNRHVDVGRANAFAPGSVTSFRIMDGRAVPVMQVPHERVPPTVGVHIVRLEDGAFRAFSWASTHRGWAVQWQSGYHPHEGTDVFVDRASHAMWDRSGVRLYGPAPHDLDEFSLEVTDRGRVVVDLSQRIQGEWRGQRLPRGGPPPTPGGTPVPRQGQ